MRAISSHPTIKMRVLILSAAFFACATGAPSGALVAPVAAVVPSIPIPAVPVNPGDLQAAFIDAKVQTEDLLRAAADQTRESSEQVIEDTKEKVAEISDLAKERSLETFWAGEEKKWQALDAIKTAEARLDGQIASQSEASAKSLIIPSVVAPIAPTLPIVAPVSPYFYSQSIITPDLKAYSSEPAQIQPESPKADEKKEETKSAEKPEESKDSVKIEAEPQPSTLKTAEIKFESIQAVPDSKYVVANTPLIAQFPLGNLNFAAPWVAPQVAFIQPAIKALPYSAQVIAPTVIKTVW